MQLVFDTEQEDLRRAVRRFLENEVPPSKVRTLMETPDAHDPALWHRMATELGLQGLLVPEEHGGSGAGFVELAVVAEEMGRAVLPGPFLSTAVLAVSAVLYAGDDSALWQLVATKLGLQRLLVTVELGGRGAGFVELAVVAEELGGAVLPGPFLSTAVLAVSAVLDAGVDEAARDLLPGIADGSTIA